MNGNLPVIAGIVSTCFFLLSELPMLTKAFRTKDLASYSPGNILMANIGNVVHSVYVFNLPFGPIWLLHSFYLLSTALMLIWYLRYEGRLPFPRHLTNMHLPSVASFFFMMRHESASSEQQPKAALVSPPARRIQPSSTTRRKYPAPIPHAGHDPAQANP